MSAQNGTMIKCGDQPGCKTCEFLKKNPEFSSSPLAYHVMNAFGRCDFYEGPESKIITIG